MRDVKIWQHVDKKKQGPVIYSSLEGQAKKACSTLVVDELCGDERVTLLTNKLKDQDQFTFEAIKIVENFRRTTSISITDYLAEFEGPKDVIESIDVDIPDVHVAYKLLLINSNIIEEKQTK